RRQTMRGANKWFVALSTALALAAVSSQTVAQDSAARAARDAAICVAERSADAEVRGFRLPTQPATGTARSTRTTSNAKDRSSIGLSTDSRMSVSCFGFAVGTGLAIGSVWLGVRRSRSFFTDASP